MGGTISSFMGEVFTVPVLIVVACICLGIAVNNKNNENIYKVESVTALIVLGVSIITSTLMVFVGGKGAKPMGIYIDYFALLIGMILAMVLISIGIQKYRDDNENASWTKITQHPRLWYPVGAMIALGVAIIGGIVGLVLLPE